MTDTDPQRPDGHIETRTDAILNLLATEEYGLREAIAETGEVTHG